MRSLKNVPMNKISLDKINKLRSLMSTYEDERLSGILVFNSIGTAKKTRDIDIMMIMKNISTTDKVFEVTEDVGFLYYNLILAGIYNTHYPPQKFFLDQTNPQIAMQFVDVNKVDTEHDISMIAPRDINQMIRKNSWQVVARTKHEEFLIESQITAEIKELQDSLRPSS